MNNWLKILVIFTIFFFVFVLDLLLFFKTEKFILDMENDFGILETHIRKKEIESEKKLAHNLNKKWEHYDNIMSFFIEHDELEKVGVKIAIIEENIKNEEYKSSLEDIEETKTLLKYIKDKYSFTLKNFF